MYMKNNFITWDENGKYTIKKPRQLMNLEEFIEFEYGLRGIKKDSSIPHKPKTTDEELTLEYFCGNPPQ